MDEETLRKEFEEWAERNLFHMRAVWFARSHVDGAYRDCRTQDAWVAWLEATRRADKLARLECAEICESVSHQCMSCGSAIRATIKEEST